MLTIRKKLLVLIIFLLGCSGREEPQTVYNLNFEQLDSLHQPTGWKWVGRKDMIHQVDSITVQDGRYSLMQEYHGDGYNYGAYGLRITAPLAGHKLRLSGYIKTEGVTGGGTCLFIKAVEGSIGMTMDGPRSEDVEGNTEWKEYSVEMPYDSAVADGVIVGVVFSGKGKVWVDNLRVEIDGVPIGKTKMKEPYKTNAAKDTVYNEQSGITSISLAKDHVQRLTNLGMLWGFLKYYHPAIANGEYNWDAELFRLLKKSETIADDGAYYAILEKWVVDLGVVKKSVINRDLPKDVTIKIPPAFGYLFAPNNLPPSLVETLIQVRDNYSMPEKHYYISFANTAGNPYFKNELYYGNNSYPDAGVRLLALYRYWNIINYFFPYRHLISEDWNKVLTEFIPVFIEAKDKEEYTIACLKLIGRIQDSHANIWGDNPVLDSIKGEYIVPFKAAFVEGKLVVTDYYKDTLGIKEKLQVGDVIEKINNVPVQTLVEKYLPLTPGSNIDAQLRDLPSGRGFLSRSNEKRVELLVNTGISRRKVTVERISIDSFNPYIDFNKISKSGGYKFLSDSIGYIYPAKLKDSDINSIKAKFDKTKGVIIDMRCYPSTFMPFTYGEWLKDSASSFVRFTVCNMINPGSIIYGNSISNGDNKIGTYNKKLVIIVNALTISNAEYTTMALSSRPNTIVLGSTTTGADGDVSSIILPGNISTAISGLGVYYPDLTETQRIGVKIDVPMRPTIKGIREGRDELLEKAIQLINKP